MRYWTALMEGVKQETRYMTLSDGQMNGNHCQQPCLRG
jgi:hypothetical protein